MKCLITAGPTYENLDAVRRLTNFSTGRLGISLANYLVERGHQVVLLLGHYSTCRIPPLTRQVRTFTTNSDLYQQLAAWRSRRLHAIFHAAAVSDFTFGQVYRRDTGGGLTALKSAKVTTREGRLLVELIPTPKIIGNLRDWFPKAVIVGWKYEVDGDRHSVLVRAQDQLREFHTTACVANGPAYGKGFGLVRLHRPATHLRDHASLFQQLETIPVNTVPHLPVQATALHATPNFIDGRKPHSVG
jgi:phosphopantothenoylcysteine decarboxylase/phosphopantothenate--cysteine ligase